MKRHLLLLILVLTFSQGFSSSSAVKKVIGGWRFYADGKPFVLKGIHFSMDADTNTIGAYLRDLNYMGTNIITLSHQSDQLHALLDSCAEYRIKVMIQFSLPLGDTPGALPIIDGQFVERDLSRYLDSIARQVQELKETAPVLLWSIGNEGTGGFKRNSEWRLYAGLVELIIQTIKQNDGTRVVTAVSRGVESWRWWKKLTPSLDIYGIDTYGRTASVIPKQRREFGVSQPYLVTRFGIDDWNGVPEDFLGVLKEPDDEKKFEMVVSGYTKWVEKRKYCIGGFLSEYGRGKTYDAHWMNFYFGNYRRPQYWAARKLFTGKRPFNAIPEIIEFTVPNKKKYQTGDWIPVTAQYRDNEGDFVKVEFYYNIQNGSDKKQAAITPLEFVELGSGEYKVRAPEEYGVIKIYFFAKDANFNLGSATSSIEVIGLPGGTKGSDGKLFGLKTQLPFYLYKDYEEELPYSPSGLVGNVEEVTLSLNETEDIYSGTSALRIDYGDDEGWFALSFQDPAGDWWSRPGGYNLNGATQLSFWAKATENEVTITCRVGLYNDSRPFHDTGLIASKVLLTTEWRHYSIDLTKIDLSNIKTGLTIIGHGIDDDYSIYMDEVVFK
ncbi:MAG: hypothetical protein OCC49_14420 [Fibrobacterales bacterium]